MPDFDPTKLSLQECLNDLRETEEDIRYCQKALKQGITEDSNGESFAKRLVVNLKIARTIRKELMRRSTEV